MIQDIKRLRGLDLRSSDLTRSPSSASDALNVELDAHGDLRTRYGYSEKADLPVGTLSLVEYVQEKELIAFTVNGPYRLVGELFQPIPYGGTTDAPVWTVAPSTTEYRGVLYFADPDGNVPLFKYDGNTFYRAGVPAAAFQSEIGDEISTGDSTTDPVEPNLQISPRVKHWWGALKHTDAQGNVSYGHFARYSLPDFSGSKADVTAEKETTLSLLPGRGQFSDDIRGDVSAINTDGTFTATLERREASANRRYRVLFYHYSKSYVRYDTETDSDGITTLTSEVIPLNSVSSKGEVPPDVLETILLEVEGAREDNAYRLDELQANLITTRVIQEYIKNALATAKEQERMAQERYDHVRAALISSLETRGVRVEIRNTADREQTTFREVQYTLSQEELNRVRAGSTGNEGHPGGLLDVLRNIIDPQGGRRLRERGQEGPAGANYNSLRDVTGLLNTAITKREEAEETSALITQANSAFFDDSGQIEGAENIQRFTTHEWLSPTEINGRAATFNFNEDDGKFFKIPVRIDSPWEFLFAGTRREQAGIPFNFKELKDNLRLGFLRFTIQNNALHRVVLGRFDRERKITDTSWVGVYDGDQAFPLLDIYDDTRLKSLWPIVRYIAIHNNILVGGNAPLQLDSRTEVDVGSDQTIYWSDLALGSSVETWVSQDFQPIGESRDGPINGLYSEQNNLAVFKENQVYIISGLLATRQFRVSSLQTNGVGCVSHRSIHEMQGGCVFISRRGFHLLSSNGQLTELSDPIEPRFVDGERDWSKSLVAHSLLDEKFYIRIADEIYVYDYYHKEWFLFKGIPAEAGIVAMGNEFFYGGGGKLNLRSKETKDVGRAINSFWKSGWFGLERPGQRKKAQRYYILGKVLDKEGSWTGKVEFFFDFDDTVEHSSDKTFTSKDALLRIVKKEGEVGQNLHINSIPFGKDVGDPLFIQFKVESEALWIRGIGIEGDLQQITIRPGTTLTVSP